MKITHLRSMGADNTIHYREELHSLVPKIEKAIELVELYRQVGDYNLLAMWIDELNNLNQRATELLRLLGEI
jgi:hypothetical protein